METRSLGSAALAALVCLGCSSKPASVIAPDIDPIEAAHRAMVEYDKNGDGTLSPPELAAAPSFVDAVANGADSDRDGRLTQDEIAARIELWTSGGISMVYVPLIVTYNGQPLEGAVITLTPEQFLLPALKPARGVTDEGGLAKMRVVDEDLPKQNRGLGAMYAGFYRVQVTHPSKKLPAKFNKQSTIGLEIAGDYRMVGKPLRLSN